MSFYVAAAFRYVLLARRARAAPPRYVRTLTEAFDRYLGDGRPAFEPMDLIAPAHAIELIHLAGGLAVWAHPPVDVAESEARRLAALGLDGIECFRPRVAPEDAAGCKRSRHPSA